MVVVFNKSNKSSRGISAVIITITERSLGSQVTESSRETQTMETSGGLSASQPQGTTFYHSTGQSSS